MKQLRPVGLLETPWTVARQAPLSMGFSRQECWSGLPFPSPGHLPDPGIDPGSPAWQADALPSEPPAKPLSLVPWKMKGGYPSLHYFGFPEAWPFFVKENIFCRTEQSDTENLSHLPKAQNLWFPSPILTRFLPYTL